MKKKTFIIIGAILLIVAAVYYYFFPGQNPLELAGIKKPEAQPQPFITNDTTVKGGTVTRDKNGFPLQQGISGSLIKPDQTVKEIQQALNDRFGSSLKVDGIYGPKTERALSVHGYGPLIYLDDYYEILGV